MESDSGDESQSDSGVSTDFSPCSTLDANANISSTTSPMETPIEREIRRAVEREHSLRRSRGLPHHRSSPEYVEIPLRKTVLSQSVVAKSERSQGIDREFAGKKMQQDIHVEARREEDLVRLGKVPGFYDKGTVRQLKERKQVFEIFQKPSDYRLTASNRSKTPSLSSSSDSSTLESQEDLTSQTYTVKDFNSETTNSAKAERSTNSAPKGSLVILETNGQRGQTPKYLHQEPRSATTVLSRGPDIRGHNGAAVHPQEEEDDDDELAPKENPFFKLRSLTNVVKVEQDIREAREREEEFRKQRVSLYGGGRRGAGGGGGGGGQEKSIVRRGKMPTVYGVDVPDSPESSFWWKTGSSAAPQSTGRLTAWPPAQAEERRPPLTQAPQRPRTLRQKNPLVQRWEAGLVNGHDGSDADE